MEVQGVQKTFFPPSLLLRLLVTLLFRRWDGFSRSPYKAGSGTKHRGLHTERHYPFPISPALPLRMPTTGKFHYKAISYMLMWWSELGPAWLPCTSFLSPSFAKSLHVWRPWASRTFLSPTNIRAVQTATVQGLPQLKVKGAWFAGRDGVNSVYKAPNTDCARVSAGAAPDLRQVSIWTTRTVQTSFPKRWLMFSFYNSSFKRLKITSQNSLTRHLAICSLPPWGRWFSVTQKKNIYYFFLSFFLHKQLPSKLIRALFN